MEKSSLFETGFSKAVERISQAVTPYGFTASTTERHNYQRVWSRDGIITSLAVLPLKDKELTAASLSTLRTLTQHQGPHGEIPSNIDVAQGHISYGGTAGRVDACLWFIIGCHHYWRFTQDERFLSEFMPSLQKVEFLLGAWEFNTKGLLYIPETGDWADEYLQHGYVLYDQLLYLRALSALCEFYQVSTGKNDEFLTKKKNQLRSLIKNNYWFENDCEPDQINAYHPIIFKKGYQTAHKKDTYWLPYFSPTGYGYRFDSLANILASLLNVADNKRRKIVDNHIVSQITPTKLKLLPAFSPVIKEINKDWQELQATFSYTFKNKPYEYHNGGLWPLVTSFYVADLAAREKNTQARDYLEAIHQANRLDEKDKEWGFHEFINGQTFKPGGTRHQTWSAAAAVIGHLALKNEFTL